MKIIGVVLLLFFSIAGFSQNVKRNLKEFTFTGSAYNLGLQHGEALKEEIGSLVEVWKIQTLFALGKDADVVIQEFFDYADFIPAINKWTPDLLEEIRGIADGSGQHFNDIFILNLLDEFWVYIDDLNNHHCSAMGVSANNGHPGYISQNMDLENYTDGYQILIRLKQNENSPEQLILSYPGLIALNGLNENGVGVCVNTLMQLKAASTGLPVAFVIRKILSLTKKEEILSFVQNVDHASGQNYLIGIRGDIYDFEASATQVVRYNPKNDNGSIYHTNHPVVNDDMKPWYSNFHPKNNEALNKTFSNSHRRFVSAQTRLAAQPQIDEEILKSALRAKDDKNNPVCRTNNKDGRGFTFASVIITFTEQPSIQIIAGPPDESEYKRYSF